MRKHSLIQSVLLVALLWSAGACRKKPHTTLYENLGDGKGNPKAAPILATTEKVVGLLKAGQWKKLHQEMTPEVRENLPVAQLAAQAEMVIKRFGIPENIEILEIHFAEFPTLPEDSPPTAMSGIRGHSNVLHNPVLLASPVSGHVALVLGRAKSRGAGLKSWLTLILQRVKGGWGFVSFHMNGCEANGHDGSWFTNQAERFESGGKYRNAFLYKNFGAQLLIPSSFIVVPSAYRQLEQSVKGQAPPNMPLPGVRPSEIWKMEDGSSFVVEYVAIASAPTFLSLEVRYKSELGDIDSIEAKQERQKLFQYICQHFPEYKEAFDGIFVGSATSFGKGYRDYFPFEDNAER